MSKTIFLTFNASPVVAVGDNITVKINTTTSILNLVEDFKSSRSGLYETEVPSSYTSNQMALNFAFAWNLDYKIQPIDPNNRGNINANATGNVVSITVDDDAWTFPDPTGTAIDSGAISFYVPVVNEVLIQDYTESSTNPCFFVDIDFLINGGVSPYSFYVDRVLTLENQNSTFTYNAPRGISKVISVLDANDDVVGITVTENTSQTSNIEIALVPNGSNADITITNDVVSDVVSPFTYSLDGVTYQSSNEFLNEVSGTKIAYVKDALGCVQTKDFEVGSNLLYFFEFTDTKAIKHRCEIYSSTFFGSETEIQGSLSLNKANTEDTLECIRGGGLKIDLEANVNLTFSDFYSENERNFSVKYIRDSVELFYGWLSPEGLYESFVEDKWVISLDCTDGLGFLKNLSYVENATGLPFSGKQSGLDIVVNCLKRTNLAQNIYSRINIFHENMTITSNVLTETYFNSNRFVKEDKGDTYMNCDEVLRSVLEPFGACLTQRNGAWYIYKPNELYVDAILNMFAYDYNGSALSPTKVDVAFSQSLGSQINNFYPHHVNENQQLTVDSAIGAYRINYKYGFVKDFISNTSLQSTNDTTIEDYTIDDGSLLSFPADRVGIIIDSVSTSTDVLSLTNSISFSEGDSFIYNSRVSTTTLNNSSQVLIRFVGVTTTYYLTIDALIGGVGRTIKEYSSTWETSFYTLKQLSYASGNSAISETTWIVNSLELPEDGVLELVVMNSINSTFPNFGNVEIRELSLTPLATEDNIDGENHTFQIIDKPSTKIEKTKEIFNGDNPSDVYVGTIYEEDEVTPTNLWYRNELFVRLIPLLRIMGEERMTMYAKPLRVFSGDIFGYVDYLSVISIDSIDNVLFMPIDYDYDALTNVTSVKLKQILNEPLITSIFDKIDYSLTLDYGNVVEPTIKG
jgi:hypothetical protein